MLSEAELTVPLETCGRKLGAINFDRDARLDWVDEEGFDLERGFQFWVRVLRSLFVVKVREALDAELLAAGSIHVGQDMLRLISDKQREWNKDKKCRKQED